MGHSRVVLANFLSESFKFILKTLIQESKYDFESDFRSLASLSKNQLPLHLTILTIVN